MKHIKVHAELSKDQTTVTLTLLAQTHYGEEFGICKAVDAVHGVTNAFVNAKGYSLVSHQNNDFRRGRGLSASRWFLVPYRCPASGAKVTIPLRDWVWIKPLIEEYNEWGATQ